MTATDFHFDSLPAAQQQLWPRLAPASRLGFVLYGGTAAALRFGHRESVDFDFFSTQPFAENQLVDLMPWLCACQLTQASTNTRSWQTPDGVSVSFLGGFAFGRVGQPDQDAATGLQIASAEDIFALKLRAVHDRVAVKDFIDVAEFVRRGYSLEKAILGAQTLIKGTLPARFTLQALIWYDNPEFADFPQESRDAIAKACSQVDLTRVTDQEIALASNFLQDEALFQAWKAAHPDAP